MKKFKALLITLMIAVSVPASALELQQARSQGAIGEQLDGYVAPLKPGADVQQLASQVNAKRKAEYARISKENGQPVDVVAKLAAQQIIQKLGAGSMYQDASGAWKSR